MSAEPTRTLPPTTALTEPYWEGCRVGELRLQQCRSCERFQFYPRVFCSHCGHDQLDWRVVSGSGRVASFSVVHRPVSKAYPAPLVVALVDLDEGPRMMSSIVDCEPESVAVGAPVQVSFEAWSDEFSMPVFRMVTEGKET